MMTYDTPDTPDLFKPSFKYYKRRVPPPNLADVLDPSSHAHLFDTATPTVTTPLTVSPDLHPVHEWKIFRVKSVEGLYLLSNPFTWKGQLKWSLRCLRDFAQNPPNRTNLDGQMLVGEKRKREENASQHEPCSSLNWFQEVQSRPSLLPKLRWATLGYHHNWDTKVYSDDNVTTFPTDLADLTHTFAQAMGLNFKSEAAIVNFYPMDATLGGHTDHSEQNLKAPLFSISLGQSAVFLIGGQTKETKPTPIFLHSGDVLVMTEKSRKCFHGVPRIVRREDKEGVAEPWGVAEGVEEQFVASYLEKHRININIRQVF